MLIIALCVYKSFRHYPVKGLKQVMLFFTGRKRTSFLPANLHMANYLFQIDQISRLCCVTHCVTTRIKGPTWSARVAGQGPDLSASIESGNRSRQLVLIDPKENSTATIEILPNRQETTSPLSFLDQQELCSHSFELTNSGNLES